MRAVAPHRRARWFAYTAVTTAVILCFAFAEWLTAKYLTDRSRVASTLLEIAIVLLAAVAFAPFHRRVEAAVELAFTRRRRQALDALSRLRRELTSFNDRSQLLRRVLEGIEHHTESAACAIYLRRDVYHVEASSFDSPVVDVEIDDPLAVRLRSTGSSACPQTLASAAVGSTAFPLTAAGDLIGFLCVQARFDSLEPEEQHALELLSESLALALVEIDPLLRIAEIDVPNNLPADLPPLIGRGDEIAQIKTLLSQSRLVTLTGAGGVGKTRLALHIASELRANRDGIWFVDLASLDDPALIPSAIASVFGIADEGGSRHLIERVTSFLKNRQAAIVLDNCEHLIASAAAAVEQLLSRCPRIQIIATSREPLGLPVEEAYRVPSLPVPPQTQGVTAQDVINYSAAVLFVTRAHSADRSFVLTDANAPLVAHVVRRLDGIAMAIELAAPRLKVLALEQLCARLNERFDLLTAGSRVVLPRHQTLRALIGWSYDLLADAEKRLLRRCAIFRGDWPLDAAEAIFGGGDDEDCRVLDLLEALVDKSLIAVQNEPSVRRYRLLETTREFALGQLDDSGERHDTERRYVAYFASLAKTVGDTYWTSDSERWTQRVTEELENYRGAIGTGLARPETVIDAASAVASLRWFWYAVARREGTALIERAQDACEPDASQQIRGLLQLSAALLDTTASALAAATEAVALLPEQCDGFAFVEARSLEAIALGRAGRLTESSERFTQALSCARQSGQPRLLGWVLSMMAYWCGVCREHAQARALFDEAAHVLRECGDAWQVARLHVHRAEFLFTQGEIGEALTSVREAERVFRARNSETGLCVTLLNSAAYLLAQHRFDEAWTAAREGLELASHLDNDMARAWALGHLAEMAAEAGDVERAALLLGHTDSIYFITGGTREPTEQRGYDRAMQLISAALDEKTIFDIMARGAESHVDVIAREAMQVARPPLRENVLH